MGAAMEFSKTSFLYISLYYVSWKAEDNIKTKESHMYITAYAHSKWNVLS